jgi:hypothetical protein
MIELGIKILLASYFFIICGSNPGYIIYIYIYNCNSSHYPGYLERINYI